jgi:SAM-dependent methyltransferase
MKTGKRGRIPGISGTLRFVLDMSTESDRTFVGSLPKSYEAYLVPLIFQPYAEDMVRRLAARPLSRVLEVAAGTGVVTRAMAASLPPSVSLVATDLNQAMLEQACAAPIARAVEWQQADALHLPFDDETFDAVVCQFGAMFFPDKPKAFSEARRVLRPGGVYIISVWDCLEENEFADAVTAALQPLFPADPPRFLPRTPYGYYDRQVIEHDLAMGGFTTSPEAATIAERSRADSARIPAIGYCQGTPLRNEIEQRDPHGLERITTAAAEGIARRFGSSAVDGKIQAHVFTIQS